MLEEIVKAMSPTELGNYSPASHASDVPLGQAMPDDILRSVLSPERPFGPVATPEVVDPQIFQSLFDMDNTIAEGLRSELTEGLSSEDLHTCVRVFSHIQARIGAAAQNSRA